MVELTKENFDGEIKKSEVLYLVDFWASWCGPCQMVSPVIDSLEEEYEGKIKVGKVNVDEQAELAAEYAIVSIPTVMLFKDGKVMETLIGVRSKDDYCEVLDDYI